MTVRRALVVAVSVEESDDDFDGNATIFTAECDDGSIFSEEDTAFDPRICCDFVRLAVLVIILGFIGINSGCGFLGGGNNKPRVVRVTG